MTEGDRGPKPPTETREQILKRLKAQEAERHRKLSEAGKKGAKSAKRRGPNFVIKVPMENPNQKV